MSLISTPSNLIDPFWLSSNLIIIFISVDLPLPVGPVINIKPCGFSINLNNDCGKFSSENSNVIVDKITGQLKISKLSLGEHLINIKGFFMS